MAGCSGGGSHRPAGTHKAVFTFQLNPGRGIDQVILPAGQTEPVNGARLWIKQPGDPPFPEPRLEQGVIGIGNTVLAHVSVVNQTGAIMRNARARVTSSSNPDWVQNDRVWDYGAVGADDESAMIRWLFWWSGLRAPEPATFEVAVTWDPSGPMSGATADFSLRIDVVMGTARDYIICRSQSEAIDLYDTGKDVPHAPAPPWAQWIQVCLPRAEWAHKFGGLVELLDFQIDSRATLLGGGQAKTWDFVVQVAGSAQSVTMTWDTTVLPDRLSAEMIDVEGVGGTPMGTIASPFTFMHPGNLALVRFQLAVSAT